MNSSKIERSVPKIARVLSEIMGGKEKEEEGEGEEEGNTKKDKQQQTLRSLPGCLRLLTNYQ